MSIYAATKEREDLKNQMKMVDTNPDLK